MLAVATLAGRNWARLLVCALSLVSVASTFVSRTLENEHGPMHADLIPLAASVLVLLALSSESARSFRHFEEICEGLTAAHTGGNDLRKRG